MSKKKIVLLATISLLIVFSGAVLAYSNYQNDQKKSTKVDNPKKKPQKQADTKKTEEQVKEAQKAQELNENQLIPSSAAPSNKKSVQPVIVSDAQEGQNVTIRAYTAGIFEDGGTCTMIATQGSQTITRNVQAFANASTTDCSPFLMTRSDFPSSGDWNIIVAYNSTAASGQSQGKTLSLQ